MRIKSKIWILAFALVALLVSCKKDYLDRTPLSSISDAEFWKTTSDLQLYCNGFYNRMLPSYTGFGNIGIYGQDADQGSDNMIGNTYNGTLNAERTVPTSGGGWSWTELRNINYFMTHYNRVNDSWDNMKPYVGEALFFRAYFYFGMLKSFGDLPWINAPIEKYDDPMLFSPRLSRKIVADSILKDLDKAISYLPTKGSAKAFRINKEIAMAFQSRVALFEGTWEKYHAGTPFGVAGSDGSVFLQKAAQTAEALINAGIYDLDNKTVDAGNYWRLFNQSDYSNSKEVMFWRRYEIGKISHNWHRYTNAGAGRGVTKNLVDDFLCNDGLPTSSSPKYQGDATIAQVVKDRDLRLSQILYVADGNHLITTNIPGGVPNAVFTVPQLLGGGEGSNTTGYQLYKGHNTDYFQQYAAEVGTTGLILFRYAEVLLNFAEAKAELGTLSQADVDKSINKLRQRVGMPNLMVGAIVSDPKWIFPALSPIINEVRRERRVELACEGYRRDDVFRWAAADELIVGWKPKGAKKAQFNGLVDAAALNKYPVDADGYIEYYKNAAPMATGYKFNLGRDYLSPLPTDQLALNPKLAPQNPGW